MTLTLDFEGQISKKGSIIRIIGWIDIKGCESIGCWTQVVTLNFYLTHDLDLVIDLKSKRCELDTMLDAQWASSWPTVHGK